MRDAIFVFIDTVEQQKPAHISPPTHGSPHSITTHTHHGTDTHTARTTHNDTHTKDNAQQIKHSTLSRRRDAYYTAASRPQSPSLVTQAADRTHPAAAPRPSPFSSSTAQTSKKTTPIDAADCARGRTSDAYARILLAPACLRPLGSAEAACAQTLTQRKPRCASDRTRAAMLTRRSGHTTQARESTGDRPPS